MKNSAFLLAPLVIMLAAACSNDSPSCSIDCGSHGACSWDDAGAASCVCNQGYAGEKCETCEGHFFSENGTCINEKQVDCKDMAPAHATSTVATVTATYTAAAGWTVPACGWTCDNGYVASGNVCIASLCENNPCQHGGACSVDGGTVVCACTTGYSGATCGDCASGYVPKDGSCVANPCTVGYCKHGGSCGADNGAPVCECTVGYTGDTCTECADGFVHKNWDCVADPCRDNPCQNDGLCTVSNGDPVCQCTGAYTGATCNVCAAGFVPKNGGCVSNPCADNPCQNDGACSVSNGDPVCGCIVGYAGDLCGDCDAGFGPFGGACLDSRQVACVDSGSPPANAHFVSGNVTIHWTGSAWDAPAACAWACNSGFGLFGGQCLDSPQVACDASGSITANAHHIIANVTITWTGSGWTDPTPCAWECDLGYGLLTGDCVASPRMVTCDDSGTIPPGSHFVQIDVPITWSGTTWGLPAACDRECDLGYGLLAGDCVASPRMVACDGTGSKPASSQFVQVDTPITWDGTTWSLPAACDWECDLGYGPSGGQCLSSRLAACDDSGVPPAWSQYIVANVTILWDSAASAWADPAECDFMCNTGYGLFEGQCLDTALVPCDETGPKPTNAHLVQVDVLIAWEGSAWGLPTACDWECDAGWASYEGACVTSPHMVSCDETGSKPASSHFIRVDVPITWNGSVWSLPSACDWECDTGFGPYAGGCVASPRMVACNETGPKPTASSFIQVNVPITWDGSAWSLPAACGWECNTGFVPYAGGCVNNRCEAEPEYEDCLAAGHCEPNLAADTCECVEGWADDHIGSEGACSVCCIGYEPVGAECIQDPCEVVGHTLCPDEVCVFDANAPGYHSCD